MREAPEKFGDAIRCLSDGSLVPSHRILGCSSVSSDEGYRHTVKLPVKKSTEGQEVPPLIGMYDPGTHEISTGPCYPEQTDTINNMLSFLPELLSEYEVEAFCEESKTGCLRYVFVRQSSSAGSLQLIFVVFHTEQKSNIEKLCKHLKSEGFPIVSVFLDKQQTPGNEIFAYDFQKLMGKEVLADSIGDIRFHIKPGSFFQANPKGAAKIYRRIQALAGEGQGGFALDLYCGTGPIAFHMAELGYSVIGVEEIEQAVASAQVNKELNIFPEEVGFVCEDVASFLQHEMKQACVGKDLKWVTVNPSRKGLGAEVCKLLLECLPESTQLLYMSCEMESLSADLKVLKDGGMAVKQIEAFDLFPGTKHLEWLTVLSRLKH